MSVQAGERMSYADHQPRTATAPGEVGNILRISASAQRETRTPVDLRDYLRALRRSWPIVVVTLIVALSLAAAYLAVAPKRYEAVAVVLLTATNPQTITDVQLGSQFAASTAPTVAAVIGSPAVLGTVARQIDPKVETAQLIQSLNASARIGTAIIDIRVQSDDPAQAASIANLAARSAQSVVPELQGGESADGTPSIRLALLSRAATPSVPLSPSTQGILVIALIVGLGFGIVVAIASNTLDSRIRYADQLTAPGRPRVLGVVATAPRRLRDKFVLGDRPFGPAARTYRSVATTILAASEEVRSICIAPVAAGAESQAALNLGLSLAQRGQRTLLIDTNPYQQPSYATMLGLDDSAGLVEVLAEKADFWKSIQATTQDKLFFLPAITPPTDRSMNANSNAIFELLAVVRHAFDRIVIHLPALREQGDAVLVARATDATIVTVALGRDRDREIADALDALDATGVNLLGLIAVGSRR